MKIENLITNIEETLQNASVSSDNLIQAIIKLLEITHANGLDADAVKALSDCGITLEIAEV